MPRAKLRLALLGCCVKKNLPFFSPRKKSIFPRTSVGALQAWPCILAHVAKRGYAHGPTWAHLHASTYTGVGTRGLTDAHPGAPTICAQSLPRGATRKTTQAHATRLHTQIRPRKATRSSTHGFGCPSIRTACPTRASRPRAVLRRASRDRTQGPRHTHTMSHTQFCAPDNTRHGRCTRTLKAAGKLVCDLRGHNAQESYVRVS